MNNSTLQKKVEILKYCKAEDIDVKKILRLLTELRRGMAHFVFIKANGETREAFGTLYEALIIKHLKNAGNDNAEEVAKEKHKQAVGVTSYFDIEAGSWRAFKWKNLIKVY